MITLEQVVVTAKEIVEERPDYVYQLPEDAICRYVDKGAPSCLVGHILARLGVSLELLSEEEGQTASEAAAALLELDVSAKLTLDFLDDIQLEQDAQKPWGTALAEGLKTIGYQEPTQS